MKNKELIVTNNIVLPYTPIYKHYEVIGAGKIRITKECNFICKNKTGFCLGVSWTATEFAGGVLPKKDAIKLAIHILCSCLISYLKKLVKYE